MTNVLSLSHYDPKGQALMIDAEFIIQKMVHMLKYICINEKLTWHDRPVI